MNVQRTLTVSIVLTAAAGSFGCVPSFYCGADRPNDPNGPASQCPGAPDAPMTPPSDAEMTAYALMAGPRPPSDYAFPPPSSVKLDDRGAVIQLIYSSPDGATLGRGIDTDGDGVIDTYTKYGNGKAVSETRDTDGNGTLDTRLIDTDNDGKADIRGVYPERVKVE